MDALPRVRPAWNAAKQLAPFVSVGQTDSIVVDVLWDMALLSNRVDKTSKKRADRYTDPCN